MSKYFAWYDNQSDPTGAPFWEGAGWVEAETPQEAARKAKADGWWTTVCVTTSTETPTEATILAEV